MSTVKPIRLNVETIYEGATYSPQWDRSWFPYATEYRNGVLVNAETGEEAPEVDRILEDYTGCTARMQIRPTVESEDVIIDLTTENGGIILDGQTLKLYISPAATADIGSVVDWETAIAHVEVERPNGDVERQYEIPFARSKEVTR